MADKKVKTEEATQDSNPPMEVSSVDERGTGSKKIPGYIIITKSDDPMALWYVVHTMSGHEARVAETLRQRVESMGFEGNVLEIMVPTQDRVIIRGGKKATVKEKIFPGYLLVKMIMDDPSWLTVRTTPGITGFVGAGNKPTPLSLKEVENIQKFVSSPAKRFKTRFSVGEAVKITDGPFSDFLGTINEMDEEKGKVKVLVSIFGRETPVELDFLQIQKV
jgi:transcriptional antiterminator NusG